MGPGGPGGTNVAQISMVSLRCRLVDLKQVKETVSDDANTKFAYLLEKAFSSSSFLVPDSARFGQLEPSGDGLTYVFQVTLTLKRPLKL
jgi:hypothetical protein